MKSAWVLNTKTTGCGGYTNFPFTDLFLIGKHVFGFTDLGIEVLLPHEKDRGMDIAAAVVTPVVNLGSDTRKVLTDAYLQVRCPAGGLSVDVTYDEIRTARCTVDPIGERQGLFVKRVKLPRGAKGVSVQFRVENQDGADFDLKQLSVVSQPGTRRI